VVADFPDLTAGTDAYATYPTDTIARVVEAAHRANVGTACGADSSRAQFASSRRCVTRLLSRGFARPACRDMAGRYGKR